HAQNRNPTSRPTPTGCRQRAPPLHERSPGAPSAPAARPPHARRGQATRPRPRRAAFSPMATTTRGGSVVVTGTPPPPARLPTRGRRARLDQGTNGPRGGHEHSLPKRTGIRRQVLAALPAVALGVRGQREVVAAHPPCSLVERAHAQHLQRELDV